MRLCSLALVALFTTSACAHGASSTESVTGQETSGSNTITADTVRIQLVPVESASNELSFDLVESATIKARIACVKTVGPAPGRESLSCRSSEDDERALTLELSTGAADWISGEIVVLGTRYEVGGKLRRYRVLRPEGSVIATVLPPAAQVSEFAAEKDRRAVEALLILHGVMQAWPVPAKHGAPALANVEID